MAIVTPFTTPRPPAQWSYLLADLRTNAILDEIPLVGVKWTKTLNDSGTLTGTWPLAVKEKRNARTLTTPCRTALYARRDGTPMWGGIIWTRTYDSANHSVQIGCGDFGSYFDHRKVVPLLTGVGTDVTAVGPLQAMYLATDQNEIARQLVALAATHTGGDIGITLDVSMSGILRDRTYFGYELDGTMDMIKLLSGLIDGPDFIFDVGPGDNVDAPKRLLLLGDPQLGQQGSDHVWEYGGNVKDYTWPTDGTAMSTRRYAVGDGIEQAALIAVAEDSAKYVDGWPLLEGESTYTTVTDATDLNSHAAADLQAARLPVVLPTLILHPDKPPYLGEYQVGDDGQLVIADDFDPDGIDAPIRIIRQDVTPDGSEGEMVTLTASPVTEELV